MSSIRTQLRSARQAYRTARYPGDLSAELLPKPGVLRQRGSWFVFGGIGATAAAAVILFAVLMSRVADVPRPFRGGEPQRTLVDWLPNKSEGLPLPKFQSPSLHLDVPDVVPAMERYQDLAMEYRKLQELTPDLHLKVKVPSLTDLPTRGVEWLQRVWDEDRGQSV